MGLGMAAIQNTLELYNLGYLKDSKSVMEIGSQELHLKKEDLKIFFDIAGLKSNLVDEIPNIDNWPLGPRSSSKELYKSLGINEYQSIDINGDLGAIVHDLNKPFEDKSKFNKFDIVTDFGSCEHVFNIAECYKTMHNLTKPGGYIIIYQQCLKGNGYFKLDDSFFEGIAASNNYKIIFNTFVVDPGVKTKNGSNYQFHIPRNKILYNVLDFSKLMAPIDKRYENSPGEIAIHGVLQKTNNDEFKIPYQGELMKEVYNISGGFNRVYFKEPMSYTYLPSAKLTFDEAPLTIIIKSLFNWFIKKIKKIIRIIVMKIK